MPNRLTLAITALAIALNFTSSGFGEEIASGLAPGEHPQPLQVRDCTGPAAGKILCYTCRYAERPTLAIFVRELSPQVAQLVKRIDVQLGEHRNQRLAAYVVLVDDDAERETQLKQIAKEYDLRHVPLTILRDRKAKLTSSYRIADEAVLTVTQWRNGAVAVSRGFTTSAPTEADIQRVVADIAKILD